MTPDLTTEIVGYRQWYVTADLELRPCGVRSETWQRGDNTAVCRRVKQPLPLSYDTSYEYDPCGDTPGEQCECGFYGLHDPSDHWYGRPQSGMWATTMGVETDPLVSGIIVAWGKVQVHHQCFRSEFARIAALALPKTRRDQAVARAVASAYGVPCAPSEELPRIAAEYGGTVPAEMRPPKPAKPKNDWASLIAAAGYGTNTIWAPAAWTWSSSWGTAPKIPAMPPAPKVSPQARTWMEFIQALKKSANRQGPDKPKRAPKKLG